MVQITSDGSPPSDKERWSVLHGGLFTIWSSTGQIYRPLALFFIHCSSRRPSCSTLDLRDMYVDDTQFYVTLENRDIPIARIEQCIAQIKDWMTANLSRLNSNKTEVLLIGSFFQLRKLSQIEIAIGTSITNSSDSVRNLG